MEGSLYSFTPREAMRFLELKQQNNKQTKIPKAKQCSSSALHSQGPRFSWRNTKKSSQHLLEKAFPTVLTLAHPLHSRLCYRLISSYMSCSLLFTLCIKIVSKTEYKKTIMGTQQWHNIVLSSWIGMAQRILGNEVVPKLKSNTFPGWCYRWDNQVHSVYKIQSF